MKSILMCSEKRGKQHIRVSFFMGEKDQTRAHLGNLTTRIDEWQTFGAALYLGVTQMKGYLTVESTGWKPE